MVQVLPGQTPVLNVPVHTVRPVTLPRYAVAVAVALTPCAEAVIVAVPPESTPEICPVLVMFTLTSCPVLVHATPLVSRLLELSE